MIRTIAVAILAAALLVAGCSDEPKVAAPSGPPTTTGRRVERKGPEPTPARSPEAAVRAHLSALQRGDVAAAFLLLSDESFVEGLSDPADWARRRTELPPITGFEIGATSGDRVAAELRHTPGLDPFRGLSPGRQRAQYTVRAQRGGFLVDAEPAVEAVLPPDADAPPATAAWATKVQACDEAGARAFEAIDRLFVSLPSGIGLCRAAGPVTVGDVRRLEPGQASQDIVAQYSTDALTWARVVPISSPVQVLVILAPLGNEWKVLGVSAI